MTSPSDRPVRDSTCRSYSRTFSAVSQTPPRVLCFDEPTSALDPELTGEVLRVIREPECVPPGGESRVCGKCGEKDPNFTEPGDGDNAQTGDSFRTVLWMSLLVFSSCGAAFLIFTREQREGFFRLDRGERMFYNGHTKKERGTAMHYVKAKGILSARNGMNIYRGCQHGCIYCDARSLCYRMDHVFEDIEVKENAIELLEAALKARRKPCMIGTGAMSDPYIPLESRLGMTRKALERIERYGFGVAIQTKSDRILRDLELLRRIHSRAKAVVQMTLTTYDEALCGIIEPNVSTTRQRAAALRQFRDAGIPTVVWLSPILPFLNDTPENIRGIVEYCAEAGVKGILHFGMGVTLRDGDREYFYARLDQHFPGLKERYIHAYGNAYEVPSPRQPELLRLFHEECEKYGIWHDNDRIFRYLNTLDEKTDQMRFF